MAVDFSILERTPTIASRYMQGEEAAQQQAERNMLRQMQMQQMAIQQENMLAQRENLAAQREERAAHAEERRARIAQAQAAEARLAQFGTAWKQLTGRDELTEDDVRQIEGAAFASRDPNAMTLAKGLRADLTTRAESRRVAGLFAPQEVPTGAPAAEGAPAGAAPAPLAVQIGNRTYTQTDAVQFKTDANPQVRALGDYIDKELGRAREQMDPTRRYKAAGNIMFDVQTGQYLPPPALARQAPDVPIKLRPGETLVSRTGEPITAIPPALPRAPAGRAAATPAAAPGEAAPGGTPAQQAKAAAQREAQQKLSQDLKTQLGYYEQLAGMGGMTSPGQDPVTNVLAYARSSGAGQAAERALGTKAQTIRDNIGNARQRILMHVKNATGATAGQMNSNVELQTWLRSLTDPQQSIETVRETLNQMDAVIGSVRAQVARESEVKRPPAGAPAPAAASAPAGAPKRREIAPGVFVTERP